MRGESPALPTAVVSAAGHYLPETVVTSATLEARYDLPPGKIAEKTCIVERRVLTEGATSDLATPAVERCLANRGLDADALDGVIVATISPDYPFPSTATIVQGRIGAVGAWAFDIAAACSGFAYALWLATGMIRSGAARRIVVCGADRLSPITDTEDSKTAVLLGDGAGAVLVERDAPSGLAIVDGELWADGTQTELAYQPGGGSRHPASPETVARRLHFMKMDGRAVRAAGVAAMHAVASTLMDRHALSPSDIRWLVTHQSNGRMIEDVAASLGFPPACTFVNIDRYGNTSAATLPICVSELMAGDTLDPRDRVLLASVGAGFTSASLLLRTLPAD
ncbi:MAG: ketoacyl-ACP synthase III [Rubricoccaceae bacterium]|nr:ketoacyl-ACP synthase III [Rubricoccaceae bacterium]